MVDSDSLAAKIDALRIGFVHGIAERLQRIGPDRHVLEFVAGGGDTAKALDRLYRESHSLAGTAPVFGYDALGKSARAAEHIARKCLKGDGVPGADLVDAIARMIADLEAASEAGDTN